MWALLAWRYLTTRISTQLSVQHMTALIAANKKATEARKQKIQDDAKEIEAEIRRVEMEKHEVEARKQRQEAEITALAQLRQEEEEQRIEQTQQRSAGAAEERATQQAEQDKFVRAKEGYEVEDRVDVSFLGAGKRERYCGTCLHLSAEWSNVTKLTDASKHRYRDVRRDPQIGPQV